MSLYCGIDLHGKNHVIVVSDEADRRLVCKRVPNDLSATLEVLEPFRDELVGVAVESTFNWYWLVDGLMDHGYELMLVNKAQAKQYEGLKHADDRHDAFWLAKMMRLNTLPLGHIYPRPQRDLRDLLRKRLFLVRQRTMNLNSVQNVVARETGSRLPSKQVREVLSLHAFTPHVRLALEANLGVIAQFDEAIGAIEAELLACFKPKRVFKLLATLPGVGDILALTIALETGDIARFPKVGCYSSYCRLVASNRYSNDKKKGEGNRKCGNKYLSWAFS